MIEEEYIIDLMRILRFYIMKLQSIVFLTIYKVNSYINNKYNNNKKNKKRFLE